MILNGINNWTKNYLNTEPLQAVNDSDEIYENVFRQLLITLKENTKIDNEAINTEEMIDEIEKNNSEPIMPHKPKYIEITINILNRCLKYISSKQRTEQIISIETISIGLNVIQNYESDLLPMVHQIWYPFAERLKDTDPVVLRRCLMLLDTLGRLAKDFIYNKTSK